MYGICIASNILVKNSTGTLAMAMFGVLFVLFTIVKKPKIVHIYSLLVLDVAAFFGIIVYRMQNMFAFIIQDMLHKDLTFTNRVYIWDDLLKRFTERPVLGYGMDGYVHKSGAVTTHNGILDIMYKGGIIAVLFFIGFIITAYDEIYKFRDSIFAIYVSILIISLHRTTYPIS